MPTKPSHTTTSAVPLGMSTPSTLPMKRSPGRCCSFWLASTTRAGPFCASVPLESSATVGLLVLGDDARVGRAHHREGHQVVGRGVHRRAHVEDQAERVVLLAAPDGRRVHGGQRRPPHAGDEREGARAGQHAGAGVARRHHGVGLALATSRAATSTEASGFVVQRRARLLVHRHESGGVVHRHPLGVVPHLRQRRVDLRPVAHQQRVNVRASRASAAPRPARSPGRRDRTPITSKAMVTGPLVRGGLAHCFPPVKALLAASPACRSMQPLVSVYW